MTLEKELIEQYHSCLKSQLEFGNFQPMREFKKRYPKETVYINNCYQKRCDIRKCCDALQFYGQSVFFGALTFDNKHDTSTIENKRKQAIRCLDKNFAFWVAVEEFGEENGRYHLHFFASYKQGRTHTDFHDSWHSIANIKPLKKRDVRYCTDYTSKQCPRVRKNKAMISLLRDYKQARSLEFHDFPSLAVEHDFSAILTIQSATTR